MLKLLMFPLQMHTHSLGEASTILCTKGKDLLDSLYMPGPCHKENLNPSHGHRDAVCQSDHALMSVACIRRSRSTAGSRKLARRRRGANRLLELLLGAELVGVAAFLLAL